MKFPLAGLVLTTSFLIATPLLGTASAHAQDAPAPQQAGTPGTAATPAPAAADATLSNQKPTRKSRVKQEKVQQSKDTKAEDKRLKKDRKVDPLLSKDLQLPDKQLYDKAIAQQKQGHFDVARLDLQTLLNTYPDSQYQMRAKLAIADSWYREGGSAALTQAEQEYNDFITFFPNVPEAAEAQMRIGDIYFKQMDVPDRDYAKGMKAEDAYRTMLKQYADAPKQLTDEARQKLREVQELLASREAELGQFYASHNNWPAAIARYQTVVDTYPQYSHMDDVLIGIGDAYEAEAAIVRQQKLPEAARAQLLEDFDGKAADAYRKVVLYHYAAPHVEDAKERLVAMNLPVPVPTKEAVAASEALEGSRAQYTMRKRLEVLILRKPDTVYAAGIGDPPLQDPPPTTAPSLVKDFQQEYVAAFNPAAAAAAAAKPSVTATDAPAPAAPAAPAVKAPLAFEDVPTAGSGAASGDTTTMTAAPPSSGSGTDVGVEIVNHNSTPAAAMPAATGTQDPNFGIPNAAPRNNAALPAIEKPAQAPDQVNDVAGVPQPATPVAAATNSKNKKKTKAPALDKNDESSSKKKPKTGLDKLNPF